MLKKSAIFILVTIISASCSIFLPVVPPQIHTYQLSMLDTTKQNTACFKINNSGIIQITNVRNDPLYDNTSMYYVTSKHEVSPYSIHQWVTLPKYMLTQAIEQTVLQSCLYSGVIDSDSMTIAQYRLSTQLINFKQVINDQQGEFVLTVLSELINNKTNQVEKSKFFNINVMISPNHDGYLTGANSAITQFLSQLQAWLGAK